MARGFGNGHFTGITAWVTYLANAIVTAMVAVSSGGYASAMFTGAIWVFVNPLNAFWALATVVGLLLILQGALVLSTSIEFRIVNSVWWLGTVAGILEILLGFWPPSSWSATAPRC